MDIILQRANKNVGPMGHTKQRHTPTHNEMCSTLCG